MTLPSYQNFIQKVIQKPQILYSFCQLRKIQFIPFFQTLDFKVIKSIQSMYENRSKKLTNKNLSIQNPSILLMKHLTSFIGKYKYAKDLKNIVKQLLKKHWAEIISNQENIKDQINVMVKDFGLSQVDICQLFEKIAPKCNDSKKLSNFKMLNECLQYFSLPKDKIDYSQYLLKIINKTISPIIYEYFKSTSHSKSFLQMFQTSLTTKSDIIYCYFKFQKYPHKLISLIQQFLITKHHQCLSMLLKKVLSIIVLLNAWESFSKMGSQYMPFKPLQQILKLVFRRLFYFCYRDRMQMVSIIFYWIHLSKLNDESIFFNSKIYQKIILPHLYSIHEILLSIQPNSKVIFIIEDIQHRLIENKIELNQNLIDFKNIFLKNISKNQQNVPQKSNQSQKQKIISINSKIVSKRQNIKNSNTKLHFEVLYLHCRILGQLILENENIISSDCKKSVLKQISSIFSNLVNKIKLRCHCTLLAYKINQVIEKYIDILCVDNIQFINVHKYQYLNLKFQKQLRWDLIISTIQKSNQSFQFPLITIYKLKQLQKLIHQSRQNWVEVILEKQSVQQDIYKLFQCQFNYNEFTCLVVRKLLALNEQIITNSLFLNFIQWKLTFDKFCKKSKYRQKNKNDVEDENSHSTNSYSQKKLMTIIDSLISKYLYKQQSKSRYFCYTLLNAQQYIQICKSSMGIQLERKSEKIKQANYFNILTQLTHHYQVISFVYKSFNQLKQAAYFSQLTCIASKRNQLNVNVSHVKANLIDLYSRLNKQFKELSPKIKNKLIPNEQISNLKQQNLYSNCYKWINDLNFILKIQNKHNVIYNSDKNWLRTSLFINLIKSIVQLEEDSQINQIYKKIKIGKKISMLICKQIQNQIRFQEIQSLRDKEQRLLLFELLYKINKGQRNKYRYWEQLFNLGRYEKIQLLMDTNHYQKKSLLEMRIQLLIDLKLQRYERALYMIKLLNNKLNSQGSKQKLIKSQIVYHQLQVQYQLYNDFRLVNVISLIQKCIDQLAQINQQSTQFIMKMFRHVFDQYHIQSSQNSIVIGVFRKYIQFINRINKSEMQNIQNQQNKNIFLKEGLFYILRFSLQKMQMTLQQYMSMGSQLTNNIFVSLDSLRPHINYLIRRISNNNNKNKLIQIILLSLAVQYPTYSSWFIASMKYHKFKKIKQIQSELFDQVDDKIQQIGNKIYETLLRKKIDISSINWIQKFMKLVNSLEYFQSLSVPNYLVSPFNQNHRIIQISKIQKIQAGKSKPIKVTFKIHSPTNQTYQLNYLLKYNRIRLDSGIHYLTQSNTANFFKQINLIDKQTTYSIFQLSKFIQLIQQVKNKGTLNSVVYNMQGSNVTKIMKLVNSTKFMKQIGKANASSQVSYELYDNFNQKFQTNLSSIVFDVESINEWWEKFNNYCRSNAQWSFLGYTIGLGDRHCENILVSHDGHLIHIDFEYNLDFGKKLGCPEWVPFRLTKMVKDPFGALESYGFFFSQMVNTAKKFNLRERQVWKALSYFYRGMQSSVIIGKILKRGNFKNKKTLQDGCIKIIETSEDAELLRSMFFGWKPYL